MVKYLTSAIAILVASSAPSYAFTVNKPVSR